VFVGKRVIELAAKRQSYIHLSRDRKYCGITGFTKAVGDQFVYRYIIEEETSI
jgi:hypothetical protein